MREPFPEALDKTRNVRKAALAAIERDTTRLEGRASTGTDTPLPPSLRLPSAFPPPSLRLPSAFPPPRARPWVIVHICILIRTYLRGGKGQETHPGRRINDFLYLARQRGRVSNLYHHPHRPSAWGTDASPTGVHVSRVMGEGTRGTNREHGLQPPFRKRHGRRMRRPYTRPGRRASAGRASGGRGAFDCARASRACASIVHICTPIRTSLRCGKGQQTRPGRRIYDFLYLARQRG